MVQPTGGRRLAAAEAAFVRVNQWLVIALMGVMATLVFANVVARYLFNYSLIWVEELTQYQMIWIAYLGAGLALREGRHVAVDLFGQALPPRLRRSLRVALGLVMVAFLAVLAYLGMRIAQFTWDQETPVLNIPAGVPYLGVPIGAAICALHLVLVFRDFVDQSFEHVDAVEAYGE